MLYGRTPVPEVLAFVEEELVWARERGLPAVEADALLGGPYLLPRLGRFEEGRAQLERTKEICRELGIPYGLAEAHYAGSELEVVAGDLEAAERELRDAIRVAEEIGADRYVSLYRTCLAPVLVDAGRHEDAADELERADDYRDRSRWRMAYARVLVRRGAVAEAVALAADAAARPDTPDDITWQARQLAGLADVLRIAGDARGAADALRRAITLHEEKGNVVPAGQLRAALAGLSPAPA